MSDDGRQMWLRERLAALEHEQWIEWSRTLADCEPLSSERLARWRCQWVPYADLSEADKERDRVFADRVLALLAELQAEASAAFRHMADPHLAPGEENMAR